MPSKLPTAFNVTKFPRGDDFSIARVALAMWERKFHQDVHAFSKFAPREKQYYDALNAKSDGATMDDYINGRTNVKANSIVTGQDGGFLAPEDFAQDFWGILRGKSVLNSLPITYLPTDARMAHAAKMTADFTEYYSTDNQTLTSSQATFGQNTFTPRKQTVLVKLSREMIRDSAPSADQVILNQGAEFMARRRDFQMLMGNGLAGTPTGLLNMTNVTVTSLATNGATPTWANLQTGVAAVRGLNASTNVPYGQAECTGIVAATQLLTTMYAMADTTNVRPYFLTGGIDGSLNVPNWVFSNVVPINVSHGSSNATSYIFYGDWANLVQRYRADVEFALATEMDAAFISDQIFIRLVSRYDVASPHPESFYVHSGVLA